MQNRISFLQRIMDEVKRQGAVPAGDLDTGIDAADDGSLWRVVSSSAAVVCRVRHRGKGEHEEGDAGLEGSHTQAEDRCRWF